MIDDEILISICFFQEEVLADYTYRVYTTTCQFNLFISS